MGKEFKLASPEMNELLVRSGSANPAIARQALGQIAKAMELPLRKGVMSGDVIGGIFTKIALPMGVSPEFPMDFVAPGTEKEYVAYTIPNHGSLPYKNIEGDYVTVTTYDIGNSIDWNLKYARDARWDIVTWAREVFQAGLTKKLNDDGMHTVLAAGVDRNIMVFDTDANQGQFTKRLVSLMKTVMRRNGGGNSSSLNRRKLTDLYISPEGLEDIRNWGIDQVDEVTRREIFQMGDETVMRLFGVVLHDMVELGVAQDYQNFFTSDLSGQLAQSGGGHAATDVELVIGLDLSPSNSFVMPVRSELEVFDDDNLHRQRRAGIYGWQEQGFGCLDTRYVLLGSY